MAPTPNIVFFGAAGSGKSSIINMIAGKDLAAVSNGLQGCTFESTCYPVQIDGSTFNLWDTAGLNEAATGKVPDSKATVSLFRLLKNLDSGVNLLVFCMRGPRIQDVAPINWRLFYEIICDRKVPIVIAVTGLEQEESMDDWWEVNRGSFERLEMFPQGVACITAIRGNEIAPGKYQLGEEYDESREKMFRLLRKSTLKKPWKMQPVQWFSSIIKVTYESHWWWRLFGWTPVRKESIDGPKVAELATRCGLDDFDAKALGGMFWRA